MCSELKRKLIKEFPFLDRPQIRKKGIYPYDFYEALPYDVDDGWYDLVRGMCREISAAYARTGRPVDLIMERIREKLGTMRVYYQFEGQPQIVRVVEKPGAVITIRRRPEETDFQREIADIVQRWEEKSADVCEQCGQPGTLRKGGWLKTLCDRCAASHEAYCRNCRQ